MHILIAKKNVLVAIGKFDSWIEFECTFFSLSFHSIGFRLFSTHTLTHTYEGDFQFKRTMHAIRRQTPNDDLWFIGGARNWCAFSIENKFKSIAFMVRGFKILYISLSLIRFWKVYLCKICHWMCLEWMNGRKARKYSFVW